MISKPLLSVIIPTKNRYNYLFVILKIIENYYFNDQIEIIIQDNTIENEPILNYLSDNIQLNKLVKYFHSKDKLSQSANSERAVKNSTGEYLCFIGDDDCVTKDIIDAVKWMKGSGIEVLITNKPSYVWPDLRPKNLGDRFKGMLVSYNYSGDFFKKDSSIELLKTLKYGGQTILNLPQFYHNIVKKDSFDKVFSLIGSYFPGPSPDMASAVALSMVVKEYIKLDFPLILSGQGSGSVGGMGAKGKHIGEIKDISFLPENTSETWSRGVPFYWSGPTIYADTVLKVLNAFNNKRYIKNFNFNYLYSYCYIFDKLFRDRVIQSYKNNDDVSKISCFISFLKIWILRFKSFFLNRMRFDFLSNMRYDSNVLSIHDAILNLDERNKNVVPPWKR